MTTLGYKLSSEERTAAQLVADARRAEDAGFEFAMISDHFHPWLDVQGQSPFVWAVLADLACATERIRVGTGVTCPTVRTHPAIVAQAAATVATMMPGRFFLGVGTGEHLNEHILGDRWPNASTRVYSLPAEPLPVYVAASGPAAASTPGELGDGLISVAPNDEVVSAFREAGGAGKPTYAEISVAFDRTEEAGLERAAATWPLPAIPGELSQELPLPRHFEQAAEQVISRTPAAPVRRG